MNTYLIFLPMKFNVYILWMTLLLVSCANQDEKEKQYVLLTEIDRVLENSIKNNISVENNKTNVDDITNALVPEINLNIPQLDLTDKYNESSRFDIRVNRVNAKQFFMELVDGTALNMVLHPKIDGKITLNLKNVTVSEVMDVTRDVFGYDYAFSGNTYKIYPNILRTRIFKINYLNVNRNGTSQMNVSSGQVSNVDNSGSGSSSGSKSSSRETISGSHVATLYKSDFWTELETTLKSLLPNDKNRSIVVNALSGIVVVRALSSELRVIEKYLNQTQINIERQVILETKILEVELNDTYQTGINWAALNTTAKDKVLLGVTGGGSIFSNGRSLLNGNTGTLDPSNLSQVNSSATSAFGGVFSLALNFGSGFAAFIELLKTQGEVQVLSSPRISTINNQKAVIKVGVDEFFITDISSNSNTSTTTTAVQNDVEFTPFFSGVALDVIPQISENGDITLHIHPTVSNVREKVKSIGFSSDSILNVPLAQSTIRESDSIIRAKNGQVVVIGGLMQTTIQNQNASVPFFGDIPIIGELFKHTQKISKKSELIILLKPIVIDNDQKWNNRLNESQKNFKHLSIR